MSSFYYYFHPYSVDTEKNILDKGKWKLYKIYWKSDNKYPKVYIALKKKDFIAKRNETEWKTQVIMYESETNQIQDPFGWNENSGIDPQLKRAFCRALETQHKTERL